MRRAAVVAGALLALALAGCGGDEATPEPTKTPTAAEALASAKTQIDQAASLHMVIGSKDVPTDVNGVLALDGVGTTAPAFKGNLDARLSGIQAKVEVVAVDGKLYLKLPFTSIYAPTDPATYGAPDPATLFATDTGLSSLLPATQNPAFGGQVRDGSEVLQTVTGTLPGSVINDLLRTGDREGTFQVTYGLTTPGNQLRTATLVGPFFRPEPSTYTVRLDRYGAPVEISKP